jgi:hypothetical protein
MYVGRRHKECGLAKAYDGLSSSLKTTRLTNEFFLHHKAEEFQQFVETNPSSSSVLKTLSDDNSTRGNNATGR